MLIYLFFGVLSTWIIEYTYKSDGVILNDWYFMNYELLMLIRSLIKSH